MPQQIHPDHVMLRRKVTREPVEPVHRAAIPVQQHQRRARSVLPDMDGDAVHVEDVADRKTSHAPKVAQTGARSGLRDNRKAAIPAGKNMSTP